MRGSCASWALTPRQIWSASPRGSDCCRQKASGRGLAIDENAELRRKLELVESLLDELSAAHDERAAVKIIARLASRHLAKQSWIYTGRRGELQLAAGPARRPSTLSRQMIELSRAQRTSARRSELCPMVAMFDGGELIGAIAFRPQHPAGPRDWWTARLLASQGALAISRARSAAELQHGVQVRDDALAAAAHEMGTSLAALSLLVNAILQTSVGNEGKPSGARLRRMETEVSRLQHLSRRMFDSARLTAGSVEPVFAEVDLAEVVRETIAHESDQLAWRRCRLEATVPRRLTGLWDRGFLEQIVGNLLSNAMKYGHGRPIAIRLSGSHASARLRVVDHGIGISRADHARIFEKFERAAPVEEGSSLGLGLWLVNQMVHALRGSIRVRSEPGAGSTFEVELPRSAPAHSGGDTPS